MSFLLNCDRYTKVCTFNTYDLKSLRYVCTRVQQISPQGPMYLSCLKHPSPHIDISSQICFTSLIFCYNFLGLRTFSMNSCLLSTWWAYHHGLLPLPNSMAMWCGPVGPSHSEQLRHGIFWPTLPHSLLLQDSSFFHGFHYFRILK